MMVRSVLRNLVGGARHVDNIVELIHEFRLASQEKLILKGPTQISLRSFTRASMSSERTARRTSWAVAWRLNELLGRWMEKFVFPMSFRGDQLQFSSYFHQSRAHTLAQFVLV
jgi:hypothetical protein